MSSLQQIIRGDSRLVVAAMKENSIDAVVTDPPYHLTSIVKRFGKAGSAPPKPGTDGLFQRAAKGFMGKEWDGGNVAHDPEFWGQVLRVLKPGGHVLAFNGTRTYHRMATAMEDVGFEIRDMIQWIYGTGYPKSFDVAIAYEKSLCERLEYEPEKWEWFYLDTGDKMKRTPPFLHPRANEWHGFGTALKPAAEPIVLARKPCSEATVPANVLKWGTGALNIGGCVIGAGGDKMSGGCTGKSALHGGGIIERAKVNQSIGRWPANVILNPEAAEIMDWQSGERKAGGNLTGKEPSRPFKNCYGEMQRSIEWESYDDTGGASRFFYVAKASQWERNAGLGDMEKKTPQRYGKMKGTPEHGPEYDTPEANHHPTVKPVDLCRYLARLVTPPGGLVLDPFLGSGTTLMGLALEGFDGLGIEMDGEYVGIARRRIEYAQGHPDAWTEDKDERARVRAIKENPAQLELFADGV